MRIVSIVVIGITVSFAVQAQDGRGPGRGRPAPNVGFTALDLNADGELDAKEILAAPRFPCKAGQELRWADHVRRDSNGHAAGAWPRRSR